MATTHFFVKKENDLNKFLFLLHVVYWHLVSQYNDEIHDDLINSIGDVTSCITSIEKVPRDIRNVKSEKVLKALETWSK